jgi:hypothetical protein
MDKYNVAVKAMEGMACVDENHCVLDLGDGYQVQGFQLRVE